MVTRIVLYQRLNKQGGYASLPVEYSRNGSPIADKNATAFYLRYRAGGKRHSVPAGANVLEADAQRKVMEAHLATGMTIPTPTGIATVAAAAPVTDRKVITTEATAFVERTRNSKKHKTYMSYKEAVEFFLLNCKKKYLDELTRDDMIALKKALTLKHALGTVFSMWMKVNTFLALLFCRVRLA